MGTLMGKILLQGTLMLTSNLTAVLCVVVVILLALRGRERGTPQGPSFQRPPGPTPWPLVGNLLQMGAQMHLSLTGLRAEYGDVFRMKMGSLEVVVLSGYGTIRKALVRQGESFSGRPQLFSFSAVGNGTSMTFSEKYGEAWVCHKRLCRNALRSFSQTEARDSSCSCLLEEHVRAEALRVVGALRGRGEGTDPAVPLVTSVANVVCALCFGKRYEHDDKEFLSIVQINNEVQRLFASGNLADFFPVFRYLPSPSLRKLLQFIHRMNSFIEKNIQEHLTTFDKSCIRDTLITLSEDRQEDGQTSMLSNTQIVHTVNDIFGGGFDTIIAGLQWSLLYLIKFPDIQAKINQEMDEKIGPDRLPRFEDKPEMPLTEAFLYEVFRHTSYVPFTIPHCTTDNSVLNGYFIPKDTCIFINQYQVNHDTDLWGDPGSFRPERFLDSSGHLNKDLTEKVMIFGMGKRRCIGDNFARLEMFIFLTTLLHHLQIENVPGQELDLTTEFGLTMKPKPYKIAVLPRR
ncbi:cytochrome P450 1A1 isoform X1 [Conger conger]|uniref:cytochrome P450 1A1 isoform X1 n=1 Tax=Conger conger TaxID=82655 RepID=UPI002A5AB6A6|nr:cytochrome P450 1A1 isoform X1 [Conger conger]XP_061116837.1 cytochrome P450 1A1 isoform X1 [Conger conger]